MDLDTVYTYRDRDVPTALGPRLLFWLHKAGVGFVSSPDCLHDIKPRVEAMFSDVDETCETLYALTFIAYRAEVRISAAMQTVRQDPSLEDDHPAYYTLCTFSGLMQVPENSLVFWHIVRLMAWLEITYRASYYSSNGLRGICLSEMRAQDRRLSIGRRLHVRRVFWPFVEKEMPVVSVKRLSRERPGTGQKIPPEYPKQPKKKEEL